MAYQKLTDAQWEEIAWLLPAQPLTGRKHTRGRAVVDAVLYVLSTGCSWHELPPAFPPRATVHRRFGELTACGFFKRAFQRLRQFLPESEVFYLDGSSTKRSKKGGLNRA